MDIIAERVGQLADGRLVLRTYSAVDARMTCDYQVTPYGIEGVEVDGLELLREEPWTAPEYVDIKLDRAVMRVPAEPADFVGRFQCIEKHRLAPGLE